MEHLDVSQAELHDVPGHAAHAALACKPHAHVMRGRIQTQADMLLHVLVAHAPWACGSYMVLPGAYQALRTGRCAPACGPGAAVAPCAAAPATAPSAGLVP